MLNSIRTSTNARFAWLLGWMNAFLVLLAVNGVLALVSLRGSGSPYLLPWWLTAPYFLVIAWRVSKYVRTLLEGRVGMWRPAVEGFVLLSGSAAVYLAFNIIGAHLEGAPPPGWGLKFWTLFTVYILFYSIPVGAFGGVVGHVLGQIDESIVSRWRPKKIT